MTQTNPDSEHLRKEAQRVHALLLAAVGTANAPSLDEVTQELAFLIGVLNEHPDSDKATGASIVMVPLRHGTFGSDDTTYYVYVKAAQISGLALRMEELRAQKNAEDSEDVDV